MAASLDDDKAQVAANGASSPSSSTSPPPPKRKAFKYVCEDGNVAQRLLWRLLRPPPVSAQRPAAGESSANILSRLFFSWPFRTVWAATTRRLEATDIETLSPKYSAGTREEAFLGHLRRHAANGSAHPLLRALFSTFRAGLLTAVVCSIASVQTMLGMTILFRRFGHQSRSDSPLWLGVGMMAGYGAADWVSLLVRSHAYYALQVAGGQARVVLSTTMYAKAMRISPTAVRPSARVTGGADTLGGGSGSGSWGVEAAEAKSKSANDVFWTEGPILHSMAVDTARIETAIAEMYWMFCALACMPSMLPLSYWYFSWPGIVCVCMFFPSMLCTAWIGRIVYRYRKGINHLSEQRANLINDTLKGIRFIKIFAWEPVFLKRFHRVRLDETRRLVGILSRTAVSSSVSNLPLRLGQLLATLLYTWFVGDLSESYNVVALQSLYNRAMNIFWRFEDRIPIIAIGWPSVKNVQDFLLADECNIDAIFGPVEDPEKITYQLEGAAFSWLGPLATDEATGAPAPTLSFSVASVSMTIHRPELVAIVGRVACGKSTLIGGLVGQATLTGGQARGAKPSTVGLYAQAPWIQNTSLRENITFGLPYDADRFNRAIVACALDTDISHLPDGDMTELGERGVNLSGGQKARIQLARVFYRDCSTLILDDPLSAVDSRIAAHVFENVILASRAAGATVLLVTHQLYVLAQCDRVIWMGEGYVRAIDTYAVLMEREPDFKDFVGGQAQGSAVTGNKRIGASEREDVPLPDDNLDDNLDDHDIVKVDNILSGTATPATDVVEAVADTAPQKLMEEEEHARKAVPAKLYLAYTHMGYPWPWVAVLIVILVVSQAFNMSFLASLPWWSSRTWGLADWQYALITVSMVAGHQSAWGYYNWDFQQLYLRASRRMLSQAAEAVLAAPVSFFDTTPMGRILNRFTQDVSFVDTSLGLNIWLVSLCLAAIISLVGFIAAYMPMSLVLYLPWAAAIYVILYLYRSSPLELRRYEMINESLFVSKLQEGIAGRAAVVSNGRVDDFRHALFAVVNELNSIHFMKFAVVAWSETYSSMVSCTLLFLVGVLVSSLRFELAPALGLFILTCAPQFSDYMAETLEGVTQVQSGMNSVERLEHYRTNLPREAAWHIDGAVGPAWPVGDGSIEVRDVSLRYRPGLPLALHSLNFEIRSGEKIGVVGRTGAGKSSLTNMLLRLVEIESGSIRVAGLDAAQIGLHTLRQAIAVIPQDPTLFLGTLRFNLDPTTTDVDPDPESDAKLLGALRAVGLVYDADAGADANANANDGSKTSPSDRDASWLKRILSLDTKVESEGRNFSHGDRQLIALARAILRRDTAPILLVDEATSSVDLRRDDQVQETIRSVFRHQTVVTIAHRLRTILGCDRIIVMDHGTVAEMGTPWELFSREPAGIFRAMCQRSHIGEANFSVKAG